MSHSPFFFSCLALSPEITLWEFAGEPTQQQWESFLRRVSSWMEQLESRGLTSRVIVDGSGLLYITAEMRRTAAQWRMDNMPLIANVVPSACYVATSPLLRGAISAAFWLARPVVPVRVRASQADAALWLQNQASRGRNVLRHA